MLKLIEGVDLTTLLVWKGLVSSVLCFWEIALTECVSKIDSFLNLCADNGGGMDPDKLRQCMSLGYSVKSKVADTIGQCMLIHKFLYI